MKPFHFIVPVCCLCLLSGCTDIRSRRFGKLLSVCEATKTAQVLCYDEDALFTAAYTAPSLLPDALAQASGMELHFGHLAVLAMQRQNPAIIREMLTAKILVPTCPVLLTDEPIDIYENTNLADRLDAAVRTGEIPLRTVGDAVGDWQCSTHTTLLPYLQGDVFRLAACDESHVLSVLSEDASRGGALLCGNWQHFSCTEGDAVVSLKKCRCRLSVHRQSDSLILQINASLSVASGDTLTAQNATHRMLTAFLREAICAQGADVCYLQEIAAKNGIQSLSSEQLRNAEIAVLF